MNSSKALKLIVWLLTAIVIFTSIPATTIYAQVLQSDEVFRYTYHSDVSVIRSLPEYNFIATPAMATPFMQASDMELFTVDIPNAPNEIHRLAVGDVFVFEPTDERPAGLAGRVVSIHNEGNNVVITASYPELDDIYSEFEFIGEIDLMSGRYWYDVESWDRGIGVPLGQQDIVPFAPAFQGFMPEINVTSRFIQATVVNQTWNNVTIDGNLRWYLPRLNVNISTNPFRRRADIYVTTSAQLDFTASAHFEVNTVVPLFTFIVKPVKGVTVEIPIGVRFTANGEVMIEVMCRLDLGFGVRNQTASAWAEFSSEFNFNIQATATLTLNIQARARVLMIPVYGIQGDFGRGARFSLANQNRCPSGLCFVIETFGVRRVSQVSNWGILRFITFSPINLGNISPTFHYFYGGRLLRSCPHGRGGGNGGDGGNGGGDTDNQTVTISTWTLGGGTVSEGGVFERGPTVSLEAQPDPEWDFDGWFEDGLFLIPYQTGIFHTRYNRTLEARFSPRQQTETVYIATWTAGGGSVTQGGVYIQGPPITLTAWSDYGWEFDGWYEGGIFLTDNESQTFHTRHDRTIEGRFRLRPMQTPQDTPESLRVSQVQPPTFSPALPFVDSSFVYLSERNFAITDTGALWRWDNTQESPIPSRVLDDVVSISSGWGANAAIRSDNTLWGWGDFLLFQHPDGVMSNRYYPERIMDNVIAVSVGDSHVMVLTKDHVLWAWGDNSYGQLGNGTTNYSHRPVRIIDNVIAISAGFGHAAAIRADGTLWVWGRNNNGQLGDGTTTNRHRPVQVLENVRAVSTGGNHMAAILSDWSLWTWGSNDSGQLGEGSTNNRHTPVRVKNDIIAVESGFNHTMAIAADSSLWSWGSNLGGVLGDGTTTSRNRPVRIKEDVKVIAAGLWVSQAIQFDGSLWTWGSHPADRHNRLSPVQIAFPPIVNPVTIPAPSPTSTPLSPANVLSSDDHRNLEPFSMVTIVTASDRREIRFGSSIFGLAIPDSRGNIVITNSVITVNADTLIRFANVDIELIQSDAYSIEIIGSTNPGISVVNGNLTLEISELGNISRGSTTMPLSGTFATMTRNADYIVVRLFLGSEVRAISL